MELDDLKTLKEAANILRDIGGGFDDPDGSVSARAAADIIDTAVMNYRQSGVAPELDSVAGQVFTLYYSCASGLHEVAATLGKSYQYVRAINADLKRRYPLDEGYLREMFRNEDYRFNGEEE